MVGSKPARAVSAFREGGKEIKIKRPGGKKGGKETLREAKMAIEIKYDTLKTKIKEKTTRVLEGPNNCIAALELHVSRICVSAVDETDPERSNEEIDDHDAKDPRGIETRSHRGQTVFPGQEDINDALV